MFVCATLLLSRTALARGQLEGLRDAYSRCYFQP
jgi:hypothetical protein